MNTPRIQEGMSRTFTNQNTLSRILKKYKFYYLLALPGVLYLLIFKYGPMFGLVIAFKDYDPYSGVAGIFASPWVGLANFNKFFESYYFGRIMGNTLVISMYKLLFGFPAPILFALLLNELRGKRFKKTVQTISYIPHFISWVIVAAMLSSLLTTDNGLINVILNRCGLRSISFLTNPKYFRTVLVLSDIWKSIGFGSIVYLAAITGVDQEQYEAADIDGANRLQRILYITLPSISSVVVIMLIFRVGGLLDAGFEQVFLLYSPSVYKTADIIDTFVYRVGLEEHDYAYSVAVSFFKSAVAAVLLLSANFISRRISDEGIW